MAGMTFVMLLRLIVLIYLWCLVSLGKLTSAYVRWSHVELSTKCLVLLAVEVNGYVNQTRDLLFAIVTG
jgi:hypothetical protein